MFDLKEYYLKNGKYDKLDINKVVKEIDFSNKANLSKLFSKTAYAVVNLIRFQNEKISTSQFRKFYDKVIEINEKAKRIENNEFDNKIKPLLSMLYSKVNYAVTRKKAGNNFKIIMNECLNKVSNKEELQNFKYFLEAIIGFMPKN